MDQVLGLLVNDLAYAPESLVSKGAN